VSLAASSAKAAAIAKGSILKIDEGASHGLARTDAASANADVLTLIRE